MHQCERAMFDLRRGVAIIIRGNNAGGDGESSRMVFPVETGSSRSLETLQAQASGEISLVLAPERMRLLGDPGVRDCGRLTLPTERPVDLDRYRRVAYGAVTDTEHESLDRGAPGRADRAVVALLKRAMLIPAALTAPVEPAAVRRLLEDRTALDVWLEAIDASLERSAGRLRRISEADIPLDAAPHTRFILFREPDGLREHIAVVVGNPANWPDAVPVRLHSACLTGDLFGSLRCDCGEQLRNGVDRIATAGGGVLLYLAQEGRGIGLANKLRAYTLQDTGADTVDADAALGFSPDERRFRIAVEMLESLGVERVRLLTNNPHKVSALKAGGIEVADREAVYGRLNEHNRRYLRAKADRSGHLLETWLGAESEAD